jgi:hypothetical protein
LSGLAVLVSANIDIPYGMLGFRPLSSLPIGVGPPLALSLDLIA